MDKYLRFKNGIFCSNNCNFFRFPAHSLSLLLIIFFITFLAVLLLLFCDPHYEHKLPSTHCVVNKILTPVIQRYI